MVARRHWKVLVRTPVERRPVGCHPQHHILHWACVLKSHDIPTNMRMAKEITAVVPEPEAGKGGSLQRRRTGDVFYH